MLAYHAKNPGKKIKHALLIRGPQGSGKNTFAVKIMSAMFDASNVKFHLSDVLTSNFNADLLNCQILIIDEVILRDGWAPINQLKPIITEESQLGNAKFRDRTLGMTPRLFIIMSNDETPIPIDEDDRRYFVPAYGPTRRDPEFYTSLNQSLEAEVPAFLWSLLHRNTDAFSPDAPPPLTAAKTELQRAVRPPVERQLREWLDDGVDLMARDIVLPEEVSLRLRAAGYNQVNATKVTRALARMGAVSLGQLPERSGWLGRPRCWAIRNVEQWSDATPAAWAKHITDGTNLT